MTLTGNAGPLGETVKGPYPIVDKQQSVTRLLVQTTRYGKYLGKLTVSINDEGRISSYSAPNPILLDSTVPKSTKLTSFLKEKMKLK